MREPATFSRRALAAALPFAALVGTAPLATTASALSASPDPVLGQIERHKALWIAIGATSGLDEDPANVTACDDEEAALQALGDALPTTVAGAATLLSYMAEVEGDFADDGSPLLRTVLTVARGLDQLARGASS